MLAYYVHWHMLEAWRPLLFADEDQDAKAVRDPVAATRRSSTALRKVHAKRTDDGTRVHSFRTLLLDLSTIVRNTCRRRDADHDESTFSLDTAPTPQQQRAFDLLQSVTL